jgi:hypothetical protein
MKKVNEKTLLNMVSVNKKFNKDVYFKERCKNLTISISYKSTFVKYREFIEFMRVKRFTIDSWCNPKEQAFPITLFRCAQHKKNSFFHIMFSEKCSGCNRCQYTYADIAHTFLSHLIKNGHSDKSLERYFHLEHVNLLGHRTGHGLCSKILSDGCKDNKMFKISEEVVKSFCI